jgi:hypothetical protein
MIHPTWTGAPGHPPLAHAAGLGEFFQVRVLATFADLGLPDDQGVAEYLGDLLVRFARADAGPDGQPGSRRHTPLDLILEVRRISEPGTPAFDPFRAVDLQQSLGDLTLFCAGLYQGRAGATASRAQLRRFGRPAYRAVAEARRALALPGAGLFGVLASRFDRYALALTYLREVYLSIASKAWPDPTFAALLRWV